MPAAQQKAEPGEKQDEDREDRRRPSRDRVETGVVGSALWVDGR